MIPFGSPLTFAIRSPGLRSAPAAGEPRMVIDTPQSGASLGRRFTIAGWAIDPQGPAAGTGIDVVHAWAYPVNGGQPLWVGEAALAGTRPDVGKLFGARFTPSGFGIEADRLPPGEYELVVYAHSLATNSFSLARSVRIRVR